MKIPKTAIIIIFLFAVAAPCSYADDVLIVDGGKPKYSIVVAACAGETEKYAAEELQKFIEQMSGAKMEVFPEGKVPGGNAILIGNTKKGGDTVTDNDLSTLGNEGFIVRADTGHIAIRGGSPRGTLYGVYSLLEDKLGVRWYAPGVTHVPERPTIEFETLDYSQKPAFEYREPYFFHAFGGDWAARNRANGWHQLLENKHGGKTDYLNGFVHSFRELVEPGKYFDEHPEYFSEIGGRRVPDAQICLTNPDVRRIVKERVIEIAESAGGKPGIIDVSQMDNVFPCQCEKCRAAYKKDGSVTGTYIRFVNEMADAIVKKYPNILIDTLAYNFTEMPPKNDIRPRPNVIVRLCHMAPSCDLHPLDKCILNERYVRNLKGWSKIADRIFIWHYITVFHNYLMPFPNLNAITSDLAFYHRNGVKGIFAQGNGQSLGGDVAELKAWLLAKLLWNPHADAEALIDEFLNAYYGLAAPAMAKYIAIQRKNAKRPNIHASLYSHPTAGFLDAELLKKMDKALSEAEELAAPDPVFADRVHRERLTYLYVQVAAPDLFDREHFPEAQSKEKMMGVFKHFGSELDHFNITRLHELEPIEESVRRLKTKLLERFEDK